ncbi:MAG: AAA family ATPase [Deltaproteobacteria bacterium]|nr:AAA family ATPase [Deltaproteobacteria bacterium]
MKEDFVSFSDLPADKDQLNSLHIVNGVVELITKAAKPFVLAVVGEWGSGKTTLTNKALTTLEGSYHIVEFNAWSHSKGMPMLQGLFTHLATQKGGRWDKVKNGFLKLAKSPLAVAGVRGLGSFAGPLGTALGETLAKQLETPGKPNEEANEADPVEALMQEFKNLALEFEQAKKPLLIFVDDLDRCTPTEALDLIDDIKVYLTIDAPVVFVVALDRRTLSMGIRAKYGEESEISVDDYLQKIFSYTVYIPKFTDLGDLIEDAISGSGFRSKKDYLDLVEIAQKLIRQYEVTNLRTVKRIVRRWAFLMPSNINNFLRAAGVEDDQKLKSDVDMLSQFIFLLCMLFELYPAHYEVLVANEQKHIVDGLQKSSSNTDHFYSNYLRMIGFKGNVSDESVRMREADPTLERIFQTLKSSSYLHHSDTDIQRAGYAKSVSTIIETVRLGLPLIK